MNNESELKKAAFDFLGVKQSLLKRIEISPNFTGNVSMALPKQCFDNVFKFCSLDSDRYEYCLCVTYCFIPIEHAVIYDRVTAKYYDPTFECAGLDIGDTYHLIKQFNTYELLEHACDTGFAPMLEHCNDLRDCEGRKGFFDLLHVLSEENLGLTNRHAQA